MTEQHRANLEKRPDVYFRIQLPDGRRFETRGQNMGFVVNLGVKRLGSADAPLTFLFQEPAFIA